MAHGFRHGSSGKLRKVPVLNEEYPKDVSAGEVGESVAFDVLISEVGNPNEYTYQWYYDGIAVNGATEAQYTTNAEYGTHNVFCVVSNEAGYVTSRTATVTATVRYILKKGTDYSALTGGWNYSYNSAGKSPSFGSSGIVLDYTSSEGGYSCAYTKNKIDFTKYSTLTCVINTTRTYKASSSSAGFRLLVCGKNSGQLPSQVDCVAQSDRLNSVGAHTITLNVSSINALYYVGLWSFGNTITVSEVKLS